MKQPVVKFISPLDVNLLRYKEDFDELGLELEDIEDEVKLTTPQQHYPKLKNKVLLLFDSLKKLNIESTQKVISLKVGVKAKEETQVAELRNFKKEENCFFKLVAHKNLPCKVLQLPMPNFAVFAIEVAGFTEVTRPVSGAISFKFGGVDFHFFVGSPVKIGNSDGGRHYNLSVVAVAHSAILIGITVHSYVSRAMYNFVLDATDDSIGNLLQSFDVQSSTTPPKYLNIHDYLSDYVYEKKQKLNNATTKKEKIQLKADEYVIEKSHYGLFYKRQMNSSISTYAEPVNIFKVSHVGSGFIYEFVSAIPGSLILSSELLGDGHAGVSVVRIVRGKPTSYEESSSEYRDAKRIFDFVDGLSSN